MRTVEEIFSDNLREIRGDRTQAAFAEIVDIPVRTYQKMEAGKIPYSRNLKKLTKSLKIPEGQLFLDQELLPKTGREHLLISLFQIAFQLDDDTLSIVIEAARMRLPKPKGDSMSSLKNQK